MRDTARSEPDRARPRERRSSPPEPSGDVLALQRQVGNRAVATLLARETAEAETRRASVIDVSGLGRLPLLSYSMGMRQPGTGGQGKGDDRSNHDITLATETGEFTAAIMNAATTGRHFETAVITNGKMTITLKDILVTGYSTGGGSTPTDQWTINYRSIEYTYGTGG